MATTAKLALTRCPGAFPGHRCKAGARGARHCGTSRPPARHVAAARHPHTPRMARILGRRGLTNRSSRRRFVTSCYRRTSSPARSRTPRAARLNSGVRPLMEISNELAKKINDRKLMATSSLVIAFACMALAQVAFHFDHDLIGFILFAVAIPFGCAFVFNFLVLISTAASLIVRSTKDKG